MEQRRNNQNDTMEVDTYIAEKAVNMEVDDEEFFVSEAGYIDYRDNDIVVSLNEEDGSVTVRLEFSFDGPENKLGISNKTIAEKWCESWEPLDAISEFGEQYHVISATWASPCVIEFTFLMDEDDADYDIKEYFETFPLEDAFYAAQINGDDYFWIVPTSFLADCM